MRKRVLVTVSQCCSHNIELNANSGHAGSPQQDPRGKDMDSTVKDL